jgi:hypothetical protein
MILQALQADKRLKELGKQGRIIIKTSDTDVIVLCIYKEGRGSDIPRESMCTRKNSTCDL